MRYLVLNTDGSYAVKEGPVELEDIYAELGVAVIERIPSHLPDYVVFGDEEGLNNQSETNTLADLLTDHLHGYGVRGKVMVLREGRDGEEESLRDADIELILGKCGLPVQRD